MRNLLGREPVVDGIDEILPLVFNKFEKQRQIIFPNTNIGNLALESAGFGARVIVRHGRNESPNGFRHIPERYSIWNCGHRGSSRGNIPATGSLN
jgi:hypothetical protein